MGSPSLALSLSPRLDRALRLKSTFRDSHERRAYFRAFLLAKRLISDPNLVARGRAYLDRFVKDDPRQSHIYKLWSDAIQLPVEELALTLLADDLQGAALRESAPVFVVIPADEVRALASAAA
jgi:hypothetical protein